MPVYQPQHVEYTIINGRVSIVADDGTQLPAYWSHPDLSGKFPALAILHDWWGITAVERRMAQLFAQLGYYVIVPDLFDGAVAQTPEQAYQLVERSGAHSYGCVDTALSVLENHARTNHHVAAVGLGMGGTLAFEAALAHHDLDAAVSFYGFPQRYLGKFKNVQTPILAIYGEKDPFIDTNVVGELRRELADPRHEVFVLPNVARDFLNENSLTNVSQPGAIAWHEMLVFLEKHQLAPRSHASNV